MPAAIAPISIIFTMKKSNKFLSAGIFGLVTCAALLLLPTGCIVEEPPPGEAYGPGPGPAVVVQDDFVYYPDYEAYYSTTRHVFVYQEGGVWVTRPTFPRASIDVVLGSPSVHMDFHDSPANHHAEIVGRYPRGWRQDRR